MVNDLGFIETAYRPVTKGKIKEAVVFLDAFFFRELGFRGFELETRTTAFLAFLKSETWVTGKEHSRRSAKRIAAELEFFTGR